MSKCIAMRGIAPKRRVPSRLLLTLIWVLSLPRLCRSRRPGLEASSASQDMAYAERLEVPLGAAITRVRRLQVDEIEECTEDTSVGDAEGGIAIYYDEEACDREDPLVGCNVLLRNNCRLCAMNDEDSYLPTCPDEVTEYVEEMYPQITETLAPTVAASPVETPSPVATMAPVMTTAPATAVPISTLVPSETIAPQATYSPLYTAAPGQTPAPGVTPSPASTVAPAMTLAPASTISPATTPPPSLAASTVSPATLSPMATLSPVTVAPYLTQAPSFTPGPSGPTVAPSPSATVSPSPVTIRPTSLFTAAPTSTPTASPTSSFSPTSIPTASPTFVPTASPTPTPTGIPTPSPTMSPTASPTASPTTAPMAVLVPEPGSLGGSLTIVSDEVPSCEADGACEVFIRNALEEIFGKSNGTVEVTNVTVATIEVTGRRRLSGDQRRQYHLRGARRLQEVGTETTLEFVTSPEEASDMSESEQAADQISALAGGGVTILLEKLGLPLDSDVSEVDLLYTQVGSPSTEEYPEFRELAIALYDVEDDSSDLTAAQKLAMAAGLVILVLATALLFLLCFWMTDKRLVMAKKIGAKESMKDDDERQSVYTNVTETSTRTQAPRKKGPRRISVPEPAGGSPYMTSGSHDDLEASPEPVAASKISEEDVFFFPSDSKESPAPGLEPAQNLDNERKPQPDGSSGENWVFCATGLLGDSPRFTTAREDKAEERRSRSSSTSMDTKPGGSAPLSPAGAAASGRALYAESNSVDMQGEKTPEVEDGREVLVVESTRRTPVEMSEGSDSVPGLIISAGEKIAVLEGLSKRDEVRSPRSSAAPMTSLVTVIEEPSESTPDTNTPTDGLRAEALNALEVTGDDEETTAEGAPEQRGRSRVPPEEDDAQGSSTGSESLPRRVEPLVATSPSSESTMSPAPATLESPCISVPAIAGALGSSTGAGVGGADGGGDSMHSTRSTDSGSTELLGIHIRGTQSPSTELSPSLDPSPHHRGLSSLSAVPEEDKVTEPPVSSLESEVEERAPAMPEILQQEFSPVRREASITQAPLSSPLTVSQPRGKEPTPHDSSEQVRWDDASFAESTGSPPRTETPQHYRRVGVAGGSPGVWVRDDAQIDDEFGSETETGTSSRTVGTPSSLSATSSAPAPAPIPAHQRWVGSTRRPGQGPRYYMEHSAASHRETKSSELKQGASLRVHDAGPSPFIRLSSSQSTEAPSTNRSQTVVAPSPDGVGYLFSRSGMRGYSMRRQSSSFSSYASFGVPSDQGGTGGTSRTASAYGTDEDGDAYMEDTIHATQAVRESGESSGGGLIPARLETRHAYAYDRAVSLLQPSGAVPAPSITGRPSRKDSATPGGGALLGLQPTGVEGQRRIREGQSIDDALGQDVGGGRTTGSESGSASAGLSESVGLSESAGGSARLSGSSGLSDSGSIWGNEGKGPGRRAGEETATGGKRPRQAELERKDDVKKEKSDPEASERPSWLSTGAKSSGTEGVVRSRSSGAQGVAVHGRPHAVDVPSGDGGVDPSRPTMIEHDEEEVQC